jgi:polyphosphate kinase
VAATISLISAWVTVPRTLPRLLRVPAADNGIHYVFLQDILSAYAAKLYRGYEILASAAFRITHNSNLYPEEEEARSLLDALDSQDVARRQEVLLHHPYESYDAVVHFLRTASRDPRVLSIKRTLYRTSADSPIAQTLVEAAGKKEVTVVVELKASFDEASNIRWARSFQDAGVQVFHGLVGLKTHAKLALLVRNDPDGKIRRYAHFGTGNYNPSTARFYSDLSLLTSDESITSAVHDVFNYLTAYSEQAHYKPLLVAPRDMAKNCIALIDREARYARRGRPARMIVKVNIPASYLADTRKARILGSDGMYSRPRARCATAMGFPRKSI